MHIEALAGRGETSDGCQLQPLGLRATGYWLVTSEDIGLREYQTYSLKPRFSEVTSQYPVHRRAESMPGRHQFITPVPSETQ